MFGGFASFFYKHIAGIRYIGKERRILIEPVFPESINDFKASQKSIYGDIEVAWEKQVKDGNMAVRIQISLPGNTAGALKYGESTVIIQSCSESFYVDLDDESIKREVN
jgi:hypothetical protein